MRAFAESLAKAAPCDKPTMGGFGGVLLALVGIEIRSYRSFERFGRQFIQQARETAAEHWHRIEFHLVFLIFLSIEKISKRKNIVAKPAVR